MGTSKPFCIALLFFSLSVSYVADYSVAAELNKSPNPPSNLTIDFAGAPPPPTVEPSIGADSLLSGKTPGNFAPPTGWTLVRTQDFESGGLGIGEWMAGSFTGVAKHSGSNAARGYYAGSGAASARWTINAANVGQFTELYMSFWEYVEEPGRANEEIHFFRLEKRDSIGLVQQVAIMGFGGWNTYNMKTTAAINEGGRIGVGAVWKTNWAGAVNWSVGNWVQWEFWWRPNTPGNSNGFERLYRNGVQIINANNVDTNGTVLMSGYTKIEIAGVYSKFKEWKDYPTNTICSTTVFAGTQSGQESDWSQPCACPNQCPPNGYVPKFYRYIDDIIIMKR